MPARTRSTICRINLGGIRPVPEVQLPGWVLLGRVPVGRGLVPLIGIVPGPCGTLTPVITAAWPCAWEKLPSIRGPRIEEASTPGPIGIMESMGFAGFTGLLQGF